MNSNAYQGHLTKLFLSITLLVISNSSHSLAIYDSGTLSFESDDQSIWGSGGAFTKSESIFLGTQWTNKTATIGGIAGNKNSVVIPAIGKITVPVFEPAVWVPTPTWSSPFKGYWTGCSCWKDVTVKPATDAVTADTRTGAKLDIKSSGKVGLEFGYSIDSGSIDTDVKFSALADLPDSIKAAEFIDLNTSNIFDEGKIATQSPKMEAYISAVLELSGSVEATACALTLGCKEGTVALPTIDMNQRIVSIDPNSLKILDGIMPNDEPFAEIPILNQTLTLEGGATVTPPLVGFKLTGPLGLTLASSLPPGPSISVDLAELEVQVPDIATEGTGNGEKVTSSGRDDLLSLQLDIDGAATLFAGLPPAGINITPIDAGPFKLEASLDLIDVDAGPVLGITQDFEMIPTLMATIAFSSPVEIAGLLGLRNSWTGLWESLPDIAIFKNTEVTPTFWVDAMLKNELGIDLGLVGTLDILKFGATGVIGGLNILNFSPISLNNLLGIDNTLFETDKVGFNVYNKQFDLGGFNTVIGESFLLSITEVPEPGTMALMLMGLLILSVRALKKQQT